MLWQVDEIQAYCDGMGATLADRVWYAIHCMPRNEVDGAPPDYKAIEGMAGLSNATVSKIVRGLRPKPAGQTVQSLAKVLGVTPTWLLSGSGEAPELTGPIPPRPGAEDVEPWHPITDAGVVAEYSDPYPTRAPVVAVLRRRNVDPAIVDALLAESHLRGDPGVEREDYWFRRVAFYIGQIHRAQM